MIRVKIFRNKNGLIVGFDAEDHGDSIVCSAVSALTLNAVNSIEAFTSQKFSCEYEEKGGYLKFRLLRAEDEHVDAEANLLLESLCLGLNGIMLEYKSEIKIKEIRW